MPLTPTTLVFDLDGTLARTHGCLGGDRARLEKLELLPGARELIAEVGLGSTLLTVGEVGWQLRKLRHLGLESAFGFLAIVGKEVDKYHHLTILAQRYSHYGVTVIGDRLDCELAYGHALGCRTIRMRYPGEKHYDQVPCVGSPPADYVVGSIPELISLLHALGS